MRSRSKSGPATSAEAAQGEREEPGRALLQENLSSPCEFAQSVISFFYLSLALTRPPASSRAPRRMFVGMLRTTKIVLGVISVEVRAGTRRSAMFHSVDAISALFFITAITTPAVPFTHRKFFSLRNLRRHAVSQRTFCSNGKTLKL